MHKLNLYCYRPWRSTEWLQWLPVTIMMLVIAGQLCWTWQLTKQQAKLTMQWQQARQVAQRPPRSSAKELTPEAKRQLEVKLRLVEKMNDSPLPLLAKLAQLPSSEIAILSLDLKHDGRKPMGLAEGNQVQLSIEAKGKPQMFAFWKSLSAVPGWEDVQLTEHTTIPKSGYEVEVARFNFIATPAFVRSWDIILSGNSSSTKSMSKQYYK